MLSVTDKYLMLNIIKLRVILLSISIQSSIIQSVYAECHNAQ